VLVVTIGLLSLAIGAVLIWWHSPPHVGNSAFIVAAHAECSAQHIREPRDLMRAPRDKMACTAVPGYLKDSVKLPVGASVAVAVMDEKDPDTVRLIADLNGAGYKVSTLGPIRRVVFPKLGNAAESRSKP
jgi:hypothetical protein